MIILRNFKKIEDNSKYLSDSGALCAICQKVAKKYGEKSRIHLSDLFTFYGSCLFTNALTVSVKAKCF